MRPPFLSLVSSDTPLVSVKPLVWAEPFAVFGHFAHLSGALLLDSAREGDPRSCWSVIALEPRTVVSGTVEDGFFQDGQAIDSTLPDILRGLSPQCTAVAELPADAPMPGALGYLGFEAGVWCDAMPLPSEPRLLPDIWLGLYPTLALFHHATRQSWIVSVDNALSRVWGELEVVCADGGMQKVSAPEVQGRWLADDHADAYPAMVERIVEHIRAGDVFQINATWQFRGEKPDTLDSFALYSALRRLSPAPFAAFLRLNENQALVSSSPELFLQVDAQKQVTTRPIKGTRPRDANPQTDAAMAQELQTSVKDRAENLMIVDLMRNDLGRVCELGSITVPRLWEVEHFPNVHHLVSEVRGTLAAQHDAVDLLCASFPPGSVIGAPKVHCLELIRQLEPRPRGAYCGAFVHLGGNGALRSSVLIRTMTVSGNCVTAQAGGGIVSDSEPSSELNEMLVKANAMMQALAQE